MRIRSRSAPKALRSDHDLGLQRVFLDDPVRPDAIHQGVFGDDRASRLDQGHQYVECAPAELDRLAVGEEFAAAGQHPETPERQPP